MFCYACDVPALQTPKHHPCTPVRRAFFCTSCESHSDVSTEGSSAKKLKKSNTLSDMQLLNQTKEKIKFNHYSDEVNIDDKIGTPPLGGSCLTSTPAYVPFKTCHDILFTPENQERKSMSPITRSTQHMCRAMQVITMKKLCVLLLAVCLSLVSLTVLILISVISSINVLCTN